MDPGGQRGVFQGRWRSVGYRSCLAGRKGHELRRVDAPPAGLGEISVIVADALTDPEPWRRLRPVIVVRYQLGRAEPLHVPGMKDLVCRDRSEKGIADESRV